MWAGLALAFLGVVQVRSSRRDAVARARKKYKDTLVDVEEPPRTRVGDLVVPVSSIDDLARISDESLKPLLHCAQQRRHSYCVLDGSIRYEYIIPGDAGDEPERAD